MASQAEALPRDAIEATRRRRRVDGVWAAQKKVASDAQVTALKDDDDVVDLTV